MSKNEKAVQEELPETTGPKMRKKVTGIQNDATLKVVSESNPKREGSNAQKTFQIYLDENPTTVQEAIDAGIGKDHIQYDHLHGFIEVEGAEIVEYEVTPRGAKAESAEEVAVDEDPDSDGF